jgi:hypothetical protein
MSLYPSIILLILPRSDPAYPVPFCKNYIDTTPEKLTFGKGFLRKISSRTKSNTYIEFTTTYTTAAAITNAGEAKKAITLEKIKYAI